MSTTKHTPGPWKHENGTILTVNLKSTVCGYQPETIASVMRATDYSGESCREANARLIAMAPTMLKGLKLAVAEFERISYQKKCDPEILAGLKLAIEKAETK